MSGVTSISANRAREKIAGDEEDGHIRYQTQVLVEEPAKTGNRKIKPKSTSEATLSAADQFPEDPAAKLEYGKAAFT